MATTKISGLTEQTTAADTDCIIIGGDNAKKMTWAQLISLIKAVCLPLAGGTMSGNIYIPANKGLFWGTSESDLSLAARIISPKSQQLYISSSNETAYFLFYGVRDSAWRFCPHESGNVSLGSANYKWSVVYANTGTINTSDRNEKNSINELDGDLWKKFIQGLKVVSYRMNDGTSGRLHHGMIAQDVEELMDSLGIDSQDFAGFIKYQKSIQREKTRTVIDKDGKPTEEKYIEEVMVCDADGNPVYGYGLRYEEFIPMTIKAVQDLYAENQSLREGLNQANNEIAELRNIVNDLIKKEKEE